MNVSLTPDLEWFVTATVKSGMYKLPSEVIRAALRLLQTRAEGPPARLGRLRREIRIGIDQADRGDLFDGDGVFDALLKRRSAKRRIGRPAKDTSRSQRRGSRP